MSSSSTSRTAGVWSRNSGRRLLICAAAILMQQIAVYLIVDDPRYDVRLVLLNFVAVPILYLAFASRTRYRGALVVFAVAAALFLQMTVAVALRDQLLGPNELWSLARAAIRPPEKRVFPMAVAALLCGFAAGRNRHRIAVVIVGAFGFATAVITLVARFDGSSLASLAGWTFFSAVVVTLVAMVIVAIGSWLNNEPYADATYTTHFAAPGRCDFNNGSWASCPRKNNCIYPHMCRKPG